MFVEAVTAWVSSMLETPVSCLRQEPLSAMTLFFVESFSNNSVVTTSHCLNNPIVYYHLHIYDSIVSDIHVTCNYILQGKKKDCLDESWLERCKHHVRNPLRRFQLRDPTNYKVQTRCKYQKEDREKEEKGESNWMGDSKEEASHCSFR